MTGIECLEALDYTPSEFDCDLFKVSSILCAGGRCILASICELEIGEYPI